MVTGPQNMPGLQRREHLPRGQARHHHLPEADRSQRFPGGADLGALGPVSEGLFVWIAGLGVIIAFTIWLTSRDVLGGPLHL